MSSAADAKPARPLSDLIREAAPVFKFFRNTPVTLSQRVEAALEREFPRCRRVRAMLENAPAALAPVLRDLAELRAFSETLTRPRTAR